MHEDDVNQIRDMNGDPTGTLGRYIHAKFVLAASSDWTVVG
jgi:hypothetical protein